MSEPISNLVFGSVKNGSKSFASKIPTTLSGWSAEKTGKRGEQTQPIREEYQVTDHLLAY